MGYNAKAAYMASQMCCGKESKHHHDHKVADYDVCAVARYWEQDGFHEYMRKHGKHFSEKLAHWVTGMFVNNDGTSGAHWTCKQVWDAIAGLGYTIPEKCKYDAYYLANMAYSDHYPGAFKDPTQALQFVIDKLEDKDGYYGIVFDTWSAKAMGKCLEVEFSKYI